MNPEHRQPIGAAGMLVEVSIQAGSQAEPPGPSESLAGNSCVPFQRQLPANLLGLPPSA